jgi:hypothetical protein
MGAGPGTAGTAPCARGAASAAAYVPAATATRLQADRDPGAHPPESFGSVAMRFGTGWAVGAWFVPILNLFRPKQIANDIWRGTDPEQAQAGRWTEPPVAPLVHWWWAAWLVANLLGNLSFRLINDARTLDAERTAVAVDIAAGISYVVAGVLALRFVRAVTEREAARAAAAHGAKADAERVRTAREGRGRRRVSPRSPLRSWAQPLSSSRLQWPPAPCRAVSGMQLGR